MEHVNYLVIWYLSPERERILSSRDLRITEMGTMKSREESRVKVFRLMGQFELFELMGLLC